uniref:Uncharacterized protein n=1 Tax=Lepeophtheirus salmonis TaxID=72036 RepID=A0A0K2U7Q7_LEPSM
MLWMNPPSSKVEWRSLFSYNIYFLEVVQTNLEHKSSKSSTRCHAKSPGAVILTGTIRDGICDDVT